MNSILVSSHRRSGTHFLIDSLRKNIRGAEFPNHALLPADFNLGSLFSKQERVYTTFLKLLDVSTPVIVKSHLLPEECDIPSPRDKHEELIKEIFHRSQKIYISRDGKDVLISLYKYLNPSCTFSEFLRQGNDHIIKELRTPQEYDSNRVSYWSHHINQWHQVETIKHISFTALLHNFPTTMADILDFLCCPIPDDLEKPLIPNNLMWHNLLKKLNHFGLAKLPESSSVRPNKKKSPRPKTYFSESDQLYYSEQNKAQYSVE